MVKKTKSKKSSDEGFAFITALFATILVASALLATMTRAWYGVKAVARQDLANTAREAAEAGAVTIIESMNSEYPYLFTHNSSEWGNATISFGLCANNSSSGVPPESGSVGRGSYQLENYTFNGNPIFGGTADLRVKGTATNSNGTATAVAVVEQTIQIKSTFCETSVGDPPAVFPALWGVNVHMGNNDIRGDNGNVLCSDCHNNAPNSCGVSNKSLKDYNDADRECVINGKQNMVIDGEITISATPFPPVPTPPAELLSVQAASISDDTTIVSGSSNDNELLEGSCFVDSSNVTHCLINEIDLSGGKTLTIDTSSESPVRLYVIGESVSLSGSSLINHIPNTSSAASVGLFGNPVDSNDGNDQTVSVSGNSNINNLWVYFPDGKVGINGGGSPSISCSSGGCSGGNFHGAVWAKEWGLSNSNVATITVPLNMGEDIEEFYPGFRVGNKTFVGRGSLSFRTLQVEN